jgi:hypothetical protein
MWSRILERNNIGYKCKTQISRRLNSDFSCVTSPQLTRLVAREFIEAINDFQCLPILVSQVVTGGQYDVDVTLEAPNKEIIYRQTKAQFDSHSFVPKMSGIYVVCFSNEFSTFSHKLVYMDFQVGDEQPLPGLEQHVTVLTQVRKCS